MKAAIGIVVLVVLASGAYLIRGNVGRGGGAAFPDDVVFPVARGDLVVTITENGSLMAKNSERINFEARSSGNITHLVDEGKTVEEGEILCEMDAKELKDQLQQLELNLVQTEADLDTARTELDIQQSENAATVEKAQIALTKAQNELEKYRDGDAPKELRNLKVAIKEAETKYSQAKKKYEDSEKLREQDYINQSQVDEDKIDFERAEIQLEGAKRDLEIFEQYTRPMTMTDKDMAVRDAQREVDNAAKRAKSKLRQCQVAVESKEQRLTSLQTQLKELKDEIDKFTIRAPAPGIVIYGDPEEPWYRRRVEIGGHVWGGFPLFTIPDLRVMQVQVNVHEADINKLKEEQDATVTMDTYPGLVLHGKVTRIATIAGQAGREANEEVKEFTVGITLDELEDVKLKPGISAKAQIFIEERKNVLYIPIQCVFVEGDTHYCHVVRGDEAVRVAVTPGITNDTHIEILDGLTEGERVLLYNPSLQAGKKANGKGEQENGHMPQPAAQPSNGAPHP
ncbi:MAG: efflux RND transporter periplasmic adaptor subunit [Phycisphaerae bacterium]|nr:efflux RND transporter periplasmic adaptor subunit [Phycisphaerae bacterium]